MILLRCRLTTVDCTGFESGRALIVSIIGRFDRSYQNVWRAPRADLIWTIVGGLRLMQCQQWLLPLYDAQLLSKGVRHQWHFFHFFNDGAASLLWVSYDGLNIWDFWARLRRKDIIRLAWHRTLLWTGNPFLIHLVAGWVTGMLRLSLCCLHWFSRKMAD